MGDNQKSIVSVASDPGSARVLIPVLRELTGRGALVQAVVSGPSIAIFGSELKNIMAHPMSDDFLIESASKFLLDAHADILLTGTGAYNQIEHTFRLAARARGLRSISVLDYWFEYDARFQKMKDGAILESRPDFVCALDELSQQGLIASGFRPEQVIVTGGPNLEETLHWWQDKGSKDYRVFRAKYGLMDSEMILVFFSEPYYLAPEGKPLTGLGGFFRPDGIPVFGYTAPKILSIVIDALLGESNHAQIRLHLLIKPHPLEWPEALREGIMRAQSEWLKTDLLPEANPKELIAIADFVIGMSSIALLEAAIVGKPAISVQVGLRESQSFDPCIGNKLGYTIPVFDRETLSKVMKDACGGKALSLRPKPSHNLNIIGSAARVADVVLAM